MQRYRRLALEDRCHIEAYLQMDMSLAEISSQLGFHKSTISREIKRNCSKPRLYSARSAQWQSVLRYRQSRSPYKLRGDLLEEIDQHVRNDWSPEQIVGQWGRQKISIECIYLRSHKEEYRPHLRRMKRRAGAGRHRQRNGKPHQFIPHISERSPSANARSRVGHWERDIMFARGKTPLLVCVERKTRYTKIALAENLKGHTINKLTKKLITLRGLHPKSVTNDRGTEFKIPLTDTPTYYCDPQAPQQRGTVENTIGLLRQYITKNTPKQELTKAWLKAIEKKLNTRPRKVLDFRTPQNALRESVALEI